MATKTLVTNNNLIPALYLDEEQRNFYFEFGGELIKFEYSLSTNVSSSEFFDTLRAGINEGDFKSVIRGYISENILEPKEDNPFEISEAIWISV